MKVILNFSLLCCSFVVMAVSDPTEPEVVLHDASETLATKVQAEPELKLSLIRTVNGQPIALINGQTVRSGGFVGDWQVMAIESQRVVLRQGPEQKVLQLFKTMKTND